MLSLEKSLKFLLIVPFPILLLVSFLEPSLFFVISIYASFFCVGFSLITKKPMLAVVALFVASYFIFMIPYFYYGIDFATREDYQVREVSNLNLVLISLFVVVFFTIADSGKEKYLDFDSKLLRKNNSLVFFSCLSVIVFFSLLMVSDGGTVFTAHYRDITAVRYAFIDYAILFAVIAYCFSCKNRNRTLILVLSFYCFVCILYGYRLRLLQMGLLIYVLFFEHKIQKKYVLMATVCGVFFLLFIGVLRSDVGNINVAAMLGYRDGVVVSNQGGVFLNANMYIGLVKDGLITSEQRLTSFLGNFIAIFYSQSSLPADYYLPKIAEKYFSIPGGGLISGYLYVWGGWLSVIVGAVVIGAMYKKAFYHKFSSQYFYVYMCIILSVFPRWFAYSPIHFFKMGLWAVAIYFLARLLHQNFSKRNL